MLVSFTCWARVLTLAVASTAMQPHFIAVDCFIACFIFLVFGYKYKKKKLELHDFTKNWMRFCLFVRQFL